MKKYILLLLILSLITGGSVGCGGTSSADNDKPKEKLGSESTENAKSTNTDGMGKLLSSAYVDMMKGDQYTMSYQAAMDIQGKTMEIENTMSVSGENMAMISKGEGFESTTIIKDGFVYMVDHNSKTVMKWAQSQESKSAKIPAADMEYLGTGKEEGLVFEEYAAADGSVKYYFDGKDLRKISFTNEGITVLMENIKMSKEVDNRLFEIPKGYQEVTM